MIKPKLKLCAGCNQPKYIWKNVGGKKFCKDCCGKLETGVAQKPKPTAKRIPTFSSKMQKKKAVYSVRRNKFLDDFPMCHAKVNVKCAQYSSEVHHKAGRVEELLLDTTTWLPVCNSCHRWIELHPVEAKELGLSINRLTLKNDKKTI